VARRPTEARLAGTPAAPPPRPGTARPVRRAVRRLAVISGLGPAPRLRPRARRRETAGPRCRSARSGAGRDRAGRRSRARGRREPAALGRAVAGQGRWNRGTPGRRGQNEGPGRFADRGVEDRFQRRDRADVDLTPHGNARRSLQPSVDDLKRLDCGQRFFLPVLRRNRSVTVVRGEVFARPRLTNRPVTADRTRVK
jgi:hypothetical protein